MATPTPAQPPIASNFGFKILTISVGVVLLALLLLVCIACGWFYHAATAALPQLDGNISATGLSASVTVVRDAHGMHESAFREVGGVQGGDVLVVGLGDGGLRLYDFDVAGDAGGEAVARLRQLRRGEIARA